MAVCLYVSSRTCVVSFPCFSTAPSRFLSGFRRNHPFSGLVLATIRPNRQTKHTGYARKPPVPVSLVSPQILPLSSSQTRAHSKGARMAELVQTTTALTRPYGFQGDPFQGTQIAKFVLHHPVPRRSSGVLQITRRERFKITRCGEMSFPGYPAREISFTTCVIQTKPGIPSARTPSE